MAFHENKKIGCKILSQSARKGTFFPVFIFLSYFLSSLINCVISYHFIVFLKLTVFLRSDEEKGRISIIKDSETDVLSHPFLCLERFVLSNN